MVREINIKAFEDFLKRKRKNNGDKLLPKTIDTYVYYINEYRNRLMSEEFIENPDKMVEFMNSKLHSRPNFPMFAAFRAYLNFLGHDDKSDAFRDIRPPPKGRTALTSKRFMQEKLLSRGELKRLYKLLDDENKLMVSMLYDTACRRNELLSVCPKHVKFIDNPKNNVAATISIMGKGKKRREVYLTPPTVELLHRLRPNQPNDEPYIKFYTDDAKTHPYVKQDDQLYRRMKKVAKDFIGRDVSPHSYRHTRATHMADDCGEVLGISRYLGHEKISTSEIYIHMSSFLGKRTFEIHGKSIEDET